MPIFFRRTPVLKESKSSIQGQAIYDITTLDTSLLSNGFKQTGSIRFPQKPTSETNGNRHILTIQDFSCHSFPFELF